MLAVWFAFPMMRRLIEYRANCVRMPARIAGMPNFVCRSPVQRPVKRPTSTAISSAAQAGSPCRSSMTVTAPPVANEPSTVRSETLRSRNVIYTPKAIMPQIMPCAAAAGMREKRFGMLSEDR